MRSQPPGLPPRLQVLSEAQEPVTTYRDALWRLFEYTQEAGLSSEMVPIPWAIQFVADVYWVNPEKVRSDLIAMRRVI